MLLGTFPLGTLPLGVGALVAGAAPDAVSISVVVADDSAELVTVSAQPLHPRGSNMTYEEVSGLDDLAYDVTLTNKLTGAAITTGTVTMKLCSRGTTTSLGSGATKALTHVAAGRWTATHDFSDFAAVLPTIGAQFDRVLSVSGAADRLLARCKRVRIVSEIAAE